MTAMVAYAQNAYRFYEDGAENTSTALGSQDTALTRNVTTDSNIQLRIRIQETGGANGATTDDYQLQRSIAGGAFANVTTTSTGVKGFNSSSLTDAGTTTQRLTNGSGSFVAGEISEVGLVTDRQVTASNYMELLYSLTLVAADLSASQAVTFRVQVNGNTMTYNVTPTLNVAKNATLTPSLYSDTDTFPTPKVSHVLGAALYSDADSFFTATVSQRLTASLFSDSDTFNTHKVSHVLTQSALFSDGDSFYTHTIEVDSAEPQFLTVSYIPSVSTFELGGEDTFWGGTLSQSGVEQFLLPSLVSDDDSFYTPSISRGAVTLTASLFTNTNTFYSATLSTIKVLLPDIYADADSFYTATITTGGVTLTPSLYVDTDSFYTPIVSRGTITLLPAVHSDADTFYTSALTVGTINLQPPFISSSNIFNTHLLEGVGQQPGIGNIMFTRRRRYA